jgi:hypothetical protein
MIWPSVISIARPRPAVMSTSVAMIGWIPSTEIRKPFHNPSSTHTPTAMVIATIARPADDSSGAPAM